MDDSAPGKSAAARPGEKKSKSSKPPGSGSQTSATASAQPPSDSRLPPSGLKRESIADEDSAHSGSRSSSRSVQPGRAKERVVRETISMRSVSPIPDGRSGGSSALASSASAALMPTHRPAAAAPAPAVVKSPAKKKVEDPDDDYEDYADDFDDIDEDEEPVPAAKPAPKAAPAPAPAKSATVSSGSAGSKASRAPPTTASSNSSNSSSNNNEVDVGALRRSMEEENAHALRRQQAVQDEARAASKGSAAAGEEAAQQEKKRAKGTAPEAQTAMAMADAAPAPGKGQDSSSSQSRPRDASSSSSSSGGGAGKSRFVSLGLSLNCGSLAKSLDPRARRLARLLASGVLDLQDAKLAQLSIAPSTAYDQYHRMLRAQTPAIKQSGASSSEETRDVDVGTDEVVQRDQEVQVVDGDDTRLLNLIVAIGERRAARRRGESINESLMETADRVSARNTFRPPPQGSGSGSGSGHDAPLPTAATAGSSVGSAASSAGSSRLGAFLREASQLCETLLDEGRHNRDEEEAAPSRGGLFGPANTWHSLGAGLGASAGSDSRDGNRESKSDCGAGAGLSGDVRDELGKALASRITVAVRFSPLQPHVLVTAHRALADEDERPEGRTRAALSLDAPTSIKPRNPLTGKGVYCVWDVTAPAIPLHVLAATGQPTSVCFSSAQTFLVLAGTAEGGLHLWDLRQGQSASAAATRQDRGVRRPCCSASLVLPAQELLSARAAAGGGLFDCAGGSGSVGQHTSAVAQVDPLGEADWTVTAVASQFVSVDVEGVVILWMSTATSAGREVAASPQGKDLGVGASDAAVALVGDLGRSPSATRSLVQLKVIRKGAGWPGLGGPFLSPSTAATSAPAMGVGRSIFHWTLPLASDAAVLCNIPGDLSTMLLSDTKGRVAKVSRFGEPSAPRTFFRPESECVEISPHYQGQEGTKRAAFSESGDEKLHYHSQVTCMCVRPNTLSAAPSSSSSSSAAEGKNREPGDDDRKRDEGKDQEKDGAQAAQAKNPSLLLVGYADGSVDLYRLDVCEPLQTWTLTDHAHRAGGAGGSPAKRGKENTDVRLGAVALVRWVPHRPAAFVAVDSQGRSYYYDMLVDVHRPLHVESLDCSHRGGLSPGMCDLSSIRPGSKTAYLAAANSTPLSGSGGSEACVRMGVVVRRLADGICGAAARVTNGQGQGHGHGSPAEVKEDTRLRALMNGWAAHTAAPQVAAVLKHGAPVGGISADRK